MGFIKNVIVLEKDGIKEVHGSLTDACSMHKLPIHSLYRNKFPFEYEGFKFEKIVYKAQRIDIDKNKA